MAVLGDKGAGKSSLLKIIASVLEPDAGEIQFDSRPVRLLRQGSRDSDRLSGFGALRAGIDNGETLIALKNPTL
jgi:putative ABC transport system ATP-binding protein